MNVNAMQDFVSEMKRRKTEKELNFIEPISTSPGSCDIPKKFKMADHGEVLGSRS